MIALEVSKNGRRVCVAGAADLGVLTAHVGAVGRLGPETVRSRPDEGPPDLHYNVGGLTDRGAAAEDVHLRWKSISPVKVGDVITVRVLETDRADPPVEETRADRRRGRPTEEE